MCKQGTHLVVSDAGPLIGLARDGHLTILTRLFKVVMIPPAVLTELHIDSDRPGAAALSRAISEDNIHMVGVHEVPTRLKKTLDKGEAEAIVPAIDQQAVSSRLS